MRNSSSSLPKIGAKTGIDSPTQPDWHTGSSFDAFLEEDGILREVDDKARERVTDWIRHTIGH